MNNCNFRCKYCHPDLHGGGISPPTLETGKKFIDEIISHRYSIEKKPYFEFGGGEVTLLRYFGDLIKYINEKEGSVIIVSNGSKSLPWWQKHAQYLSGVSLSYHINDIKNEGHFINVAKVLEESMTTRLHVNVMMVPENFDDCVVFANKFRDQIRCSIALQPLFEGFGHGGITKKYPYTYEQERIMQDFRGRSELKELPPSLAELTVEYSDGSTQSLSTFDLLASDQTNFIGWDCYAGIDSLVVTFSGDIHRAWCMQDGPIGSIYDDEIKLPTAPTKCRTKICQCGVDLSSKKVSTKLLTNQATEIEVKLV